MAEITLAVVTYNQVAYLRDFIGNYLRFARPEVVPLLVVNDGSTDGTRDFLDGLPSTHIRVENLSHVSAAHARNHALAIVPTPWLAFSDSDCRLDAEYFALLAEVPRKFPDCAAVEGAVHAPEGPRPPFSHSLSNRTGGMFATANMIFRVEATRRVGGFDEGFPVNFREDVDLGLRLLEAGEKIEFCSELKVVHPHVPRRLLRSLKAAFTQLPKLVEAEVRLYAKHPHTYARVRYHRHWRATLLAWCTRPVVTAWRDSRAFLREVSRKTGTARRGAGIREWKQCLMAIAVALVEQVAVAGILLLRWKRLANGGRL